MRRTALSTLVSAAAGIGLVLLAVYGTGSYGCVLFIAVPIFLGFATTAAMPKPSTFGRSYAFSIGATSLVGITMMLGRLEGVICLALASPLFLPLVALGTRLAWELFHAQKLPRPEATTLIVAALLATAATFEPSFEPRARVIAAADSIDIDAPPQKVWRTIVTLRDIEKPDDLVFRSGIACPQTARIVKSGNGGLRVCTMTTGTVVERIDVWEPGRTLGWTALSTPPPMKELNPFGEVDAPHLHGYYRNVRGEFALEPLPRGRTRLTRRTWYEHDLYPSAYWRIWLDYGASKIHRLVLEHVRAEVMRG